MCAGLVVYNLNLSLLSTNIAEHPTGRVYRKYLRLLFYCFLGMDSCLKKYRCGCRMLVELLR